MERFAQDSSVVPRCNELGAVTRTSHRSIGAINASRVSDIIYNHDITHEVVKCARLRAPIANIRFLSWHLGSRGM